MALKDFGKSENDRGLWFPFGEEDPAPFEVRIRRIPYDIAHRINKQYGREQVVTVDGVRRPHIERTIEEQTRWLLTQAAWAWTEARGLEIEVSDDEAARLWTGLLKRDVTVGEVLKLDSGETLTDAVKQRILTQLRPYSTMTTVDDDTGKASTSRVDLGTFIIIKAAQIQQDFAKAAETSRSN
jgi:hypothetical protein